MVLVVSASVLVTNDNNTCTSTRPKESEQVSFGAHADGSTARTGIIVSATARKGELPLIDQLTLTSLQSLSTSSQAVGQSARCLRQGLFRYHRLSSSIRLRSIGASIWRTAIEIPKAVCRSWGMDYWRVYGEREATREKRRASTTSSSFVLSLDVHSTAINP